MIPEDELGRADPGLSRRLDTSGVMPTELSAAAGVELGGGPGGGPGTGPVARSQWQLFRKRFLRHRMAVISLVVLAVLIVLCFGATFFAPFTRDGQDLLLGPVSPNGTHWFGTDELGRDQFTRLLYAGQISIEIGITVALISTVFGTSVGAVAGFFGRATDQALMRFTDLFLVVPDIAILALALQYFGQSNITIVLVLAGIFWMYIARVVRGQVLSLKEKEFVEAARAAGASPFRIITRHLLPNTIGTIMVDATLAVAGAIITESTLSFLGFGVQPPETSWGKMLSDAEGAIGTEKAYLLLFPGLAILLTVLAVNFIGDGLRDAFDPQSGRR